MVEVVPQGYVACREGASCDVPATDQPRPDALHAPGCTALPPHPTRPPTHAHTRTLLRLLERLERVLVCVVVPDVDGHHVGLILEPQGLHKVGQRRALVPVNLEHNGTGHTQGAGVGRGPCGREYMGRGEGAWQDCCRKH